MESILISSVGSKFDTSFHLSFPLQNVKSYQPDKTSSHRPSVQHLPSLEIKSNHLTIFLTARLPKRSKEQLCLSAFSCTICSILVYFVILEVSDEFRRVYMRVSRLTRNDTTFYQIALQLFRKCLQHYDKSGHV